MSNQSTIHPGWYVSNELKNRGRTQKQFADLIGKKISELNELINGKRNITIQWDILLSAAFGDQEGKWINMQNQHDFYIVKLTMDANKISDIKRKRGLIHKEDVFNKF